MKKALLSLCCLLSAGSFYAWAEGGQYLHIQTSEGWKVLDLDKADKLTFTSGTMVVSDADNNTLDTFDRNSLSMMYVDDTKDLSGVQTVIDDTEATFRLKGSVATMLSDGIFEVFSIDGKLLVSINARKGETIDLSAMTGNLVIMKSGSFTIKSNLR